jgi:transposase
MGTSAREVARLLGMSPNTERAYRGAIENVHLLAGPVDALPELADLRRAVEAAMPAKPTPPQQCSSVERWADRVRAMLETGATPTAIYDCLRLREPDFAGSLSAIKRLCLRLARAKGVDASDVVIPVETAAGEVAQVDFGGIGKLLDPDSGRMREAYVFVLVLGYSRHMVVRIVFDQKSETWLGLHAEAFDELGSVPRVLVPDNLKAAVVRAAFGVSDDVVLNRAYRELARHYGFKIDPTPPYSPEKKGKVESGVKYVQRNFMKPRMEQKDVTALRPELARWVREIAGMRTHGSTRKRPLEVFEQIERPCMLELPERRWEPVLWRSPALRSDCRAIVDNARYSAPWKLIGKRLLARVTATSVELYFEDTRVATHERKPAGGESIREEHLPPARSEYRHRSRIYWEERAEKLGADVLSYIREVFDHDDVLHQLRAVQGIVRHLETFPIERARAACRRASYYACYRYVGIKQILSKALDLQPLPTALVPAETSDGRPRFARNVQELLNINTEERDHDAPH